MPSPSTQSQSGTLPEYPVRRAPGECPFGPPRDLSALQEAAPVRRVQIWDGSTPWLVTGYDEVRTVLSHEGISSDGDVPGYPHFSIGDIARRKQSKPLLNLDGAEHDDLRRLITRDFTVRRAEQLRPFIAGIVDSLLDDMAAGPNPTDLVEALALPLPTRLICHILGVPYSLRDHFHALSVVVMSTDSTPDQVTTAQGGILELFEELVEERLARPADDLVSRLATDHLRPGHLTREQTVGLLNLLLVAGHESTMGMIALGTTTLLTHPAAAATLRETEDRAVIARIVEELLRWINPLNVGRRRIAATDIGVGGQVIPAGQGVICVNDVADRDPRAVERPHEFDITRSPNRHMAFAFGPHQCLGQNVARVELQVVYKKLFDRFPALALAAPLGELEFRENALAHGMDRLPVTW